MAAVLACLAFVIALVVRITSGHAAVVTEIALAGLALLAFHVAMTAPWYPWRRPPGTP